MSLTPLTVDFPYNYTEIFLASLQKLHKRQPAQGAAIIPDDVAKHAGGSADWEHPTLIKIFSVAQRGNACDTTG
ncbi:MAG: hypothetical protein MUC60_18940 [Oscillatoria sp. Prado101]|nr:hypothetical protein [Oscillatoria sp. Prado101]